MACDRDLAFIASALLGQTLNDICTISCGSCTCPEPYDGAQTSSHRHTSSSSSSSRAGSARRLCGRCARRSGADGGLLRSGLRGGHRGRLSAQDGRGGPGCLLPGDERRHQPRLRAVHAVRARGAPQRTAPVSLETFLTQTLKQLHLCGSSLSDPVYPSFYKCSSVPFHVINV